MSKIKKKNSLIKWFAELLKNTLANWNTSFNFLAFYIAFFLYIAGTFIIASAEMGNEAGSTSIIASTFLSQGGILVICLLVYINFANLPSDEKYMTHKVIKRLYIVVGILLLATRLTGSTNGAYAWINLGPASFQPSEIAKVFVLYSGSILLSEKDKKKLAENAKEYLWGVFIYVGIIFAYEKDTGSAVILLMIGFFELFLTRAFMPKWIKKTLYGCLIGGSILVVFIYTPLATTVFDALASKSYIFARFASFINPFVYQYDYGYHLIMSLTSFATGGLFGLGYTKSIHKYMNFPNPENDFILPVFVEEFGFIGFLFLLAAYLVLFGNLISHSLKIKNRKGKLVLMSTFIYIAFHFILNVGGVTGLLPLTGVPLLLISKGGSSSMALFACLGLCYREIKRNKGLNENNSREV